MSIKVECDKCGQEVDGVYVAVFRFWGAVPLALAARPEAGAFDEDFYICDDCLAVVLETLSGGANER